MNKYQKAERIIDIIFKTLNHLVRLGFMGVLLIVLIDYLIMKNPSWATFDSIWNIYLVSIVIYTLVLFTKFMIRVLKSEGEGEYRVRGATGPIGKFRGKLKEKEDEKDED